VVLCLHGLTRNSADFDALAAHLAPRFRVIVPDQRGRGRSAYDPDPSRYQPPVYVRDTWRLLDHLGVGHASVVGTSMGGLMAILMVASAPERVGAVVLNDIGPEVDPRGLRRIMSYVGKGEPVTDWAGAVEALRKLNGEIFPDYGDEQWRTMARRTFREDDRGVPVLDYDPAISRPIAEDERAAAPPALWPLFDLMRWTPLLVIRGETSDILAADCLARMQARRPDLRVCVVPRRGHAPDLGEPEAMAAIDAFLADFAAAPPPARSTWWRAAFAGGWRAVAAAVAMRRALRR
jgi:pimeloyl-ACP methyl ester carboxylesterase